jgi:hypothetical protein
MGEGGAAPLHTVCAALQDALEPAGIIISNSHNTADSLFLALQGRVAATPVRVLSRAARR